MKLVYTEQALISLDEAILDDLFDEMITEFFPPILLRTCGGDFSLIENLIFNVEAGIFPRMAAIDSLVLGVAASLIKRDHVVHILQNLIITQRNDVSFYIIDYAITQLIELYPEESLDLIEETINSNFLKEDQIDTKHIYETIESTMKSGKEACLNNLKKLLENSWDNDNVHTMLNSKICPIIYEGTDDSDCNLPVIAKTSLSQNIKKKKKKLKKLKKLSKKQNKKKKKK